MRSILLTILMAAAFALPASAGEGIAIDAPSAPIQVREYVQILLPGVGVNDDSLKNLTLDWNPKAEATVIPARFWGGAPFILFTAKRPGRYEITVSENAWAGSLVSAIDAAMPAIDKETGDRLAAIKADVSSRYQHRTGRCVVEVAGENPPVPPVPPTTEVAWAMILRDAGQRDQSTTGLELDLTNHEFRKGRTILFESPGATDEAGKPVKEVARAVEAVGKASLPQLVGFSTDGLVVFRVDCPNTAAGVVAELKARGMK